VRFYHVSSTRNRASITAYGLDWSRMGEARGIAGSSRPEEQGCFICLHEFDVKFFVSMNNSGGPVDVWAIDGIEENELIDAGSGFLYFPGIIPPEKVSLVQKDLEGGELGPRKF
jgi:hypothetical protein